jgi:hypothetical protein
MRIGRHAYSMQYHMELEPETIPAWGCVPAYQEALEKVRGKGALEALAQEAAPLMPSFVDNARLLYRNFMKAAAP